ncbi:hypothetical protein BDV96DRAFT_322952 [Lophiotrema nucula]|uniref:Uncharacterized protein n=1 Tax=Lophiotrema nucula TaxID=690887 RepID=A0A6A5ZMU2_9PLEO|nr:hypothetical protein BDV96DRAFT_322952 [Lophiotrema nucula]
MTLEIVRPEWLPAMRKLQFGSRRPGHRMRMPFKLFAHRRLTRGVSLVASSTNTRTLLTAARALTVAEKQKKSNRKIALASCHVSGCVCELPLDPERLRVKPSGRSQYPPSDKRVRSSNYPVQLQREDSWTGTLRLISAPTSKRSTPDQRQHHFSLPANAIICQTCCESSYREGQIRSRIPPTPGLPGRSPVPASQDGRAGKELAPTGSRAE